MHGQRRDEYKARLRDDATAAKIAKKASQWYLLSAELSKRRTMEKMVRREEEKEKEKEKEKEQSTSTVTVKATRKTAIETLTFIDKLLSVNPDPIYLWNHRREVLLSLMTLNSNPNTCNAIEMKTDIDVTADADSTTDVTTDADAFIQQEQIVTQTALQRNPKAYGAWFHRKWSIRQMIMIIMASLSSKTSSSSSTNSDVHEGEHGGEYGMNTNQAPYKKILQVLEGELVLCAEFLTLDERNFHCWNYRRFIVSTLAHMYNHINDNGIVGDDDHDHVDIRSGVDGGWNFLDIDKDYLEDVPIIGPQLTSSSSSSSSSLSSYQTKNSSNTEQIQALLEQEWKFTSEKIYQNFSNGSAFHYRSKLLPMRLYFESKSKESQSKSSMSMSRKEWVREELELIRNAIFTEPDDQTSWWYFRFILSWANPITRQNITTSCDTTKDIEGHHDGKGQASGHRSTTLLSLTSDEEEMVEGYKEMLHEEWMSIQELVEAEDGNCKWGLLGLYMIAMTFHDLEKKGIHGSIEYEGENWLELARSYLQDLKMLDPDRKQRYESMEQELA